MTLTRTQAAQNMIAEKDVTRIGKADGAEYVRHRGKLWRVGRRPAPDSAGYFPREDRRFLLVRKTRDVDGYREDTTVAYQLDLVSDDAYERARAADEAKAADAAKRAEKARPQPVNVFRRWTLLAGRKGNPETLGGLTPVRSALALVPREGGLPAIPDLSPDAVEYANRRLQAEKPTVALVPDIPPVETISDLVRWAAEHVTLTVVNDDQLQRLWPEGRIKVPVSEILDQFEGVIIDHLSGVERRCVFTQDCEGVADRQADGFVDWDGCDGIHPTRARKGAA